MPTFTLYGCRGSTNTDRVRLTLAEGGFSDYEYVVLNLQQGEQKAPAHLQRHPWGKVPAITFPDGLTLYESRPICKYVASKYSIPLLPPPTDLAATAVFDQAQSVEMIYFAEPAGKIAFEKFAKNLMGLPTDEAVVAAAVQSLKLFLDVAEKLLSERTYMAGGDFSLVDIYYIPLVERLFACGYKDLIMDRTNVSTWYERCVSRTAIRDFLKAETQGKKADRR